MTEGLFKQFSGPSFRNDFFQIVLLSFQSFHDIFVSISLHAVCLESRYKGPTASIVSLERQRQCGVNEITHVSKR